MKQFVLLLIMSAQLLFTNMVYSATVVKEKHLTTKVSKIDIKIKNDWDDEVTVINSNSGGTYRLSKNVVTTIKMEVGDKLYFYTNGKKGKLILTAAAEMNGKVQLLSKLQ